jgi:hypothetical protein
MLDVFKVIFAMLFALVVISNTGIAGGATIRTVNSVQSNSGAEGTIVKRLKFPGAARSNKSTPDDVGHGTHLCSADEHCGSGHKCCSGHCMAVDTCG